MIINGYEIQGELNNANSGFSKWGFAVKNKHIYFIKELINPVYPTDENELSGDLLAERRLYCRQFEQRFKRIYEAINAASCGNLVRIVEFFRWNGRYYIVTERAGNNAISVKGISGLPALKKYFLMKSAAFCFACFHQTGLVHFDVKPTNIIIKETVNKQYVAKLIDFDSGFFKEEIRENIELGGDLTYLAPETFLHIRGEDVQLDEKVDIFALGLVFHEYFCGCLPFYDKNEYDYPYEAALTLGFLQPDYDALPERLGKLIGAMLSVEPEKRPSAKEIVNCLSEIIAEESGNIIHIPSIPVVKRDFSDKGIERKHDVNEEWFSSAGDL